MTDVSKWTREDVREWLVEKGFAEYTELLVDTHEVDGEVLLSLNETDLKSPPLEIKKLSHVKKLYNSIKALHLENNNNNNLRNGRSGCCLGSPSERRRLLVDGNTTDTDSEYEYCDREFLPERRKFWWSFLYAFFVMWATAFSMVFCHEKVPDMNKYPPLPDIFLDNVPLIPYAFKMSEVCALILCLIWIGILIIHKHRYILLRRFFSITSTIFLLRSITMFVTSLSVPGEHLECEAIFHDSMKTRFQRAAHIVSGLGMSLTGVQTCGDYMFSGHTAYLTLFNHFITEYTPTRLNYLHTFSWVLNLFGIFFVLAAHEHYTIDVMIAFYIASRVFLYYHMMANTQSYERSRRIRYYFPALSYFECNVPGKVPNEYEYPQFPTFLRFSFSWRHIVSKSE